MLSATARSKLSVCSMVVMMQPALAGCIIGGSGSQTPGAFTSPSPTDRSCPRSIHAPNVTPYYACPEEKIQITAEICQVSDATISIIVGQNSLFNQRHITVSAGIDRLSEEFSAPTQIGTYSVVIEAGNSRVFMEPHIKSCP